MKDLIRFPWATVAWCIIGTVLAVPVPLDAGTSQATTKGWVLKPGPAVTQPASPASHRLKTPAPPQPRVTRGKVHVPSSSGALSGTHHVPQRSWREAALLRRMLVARFPVMPQEQRPQALDAWQIRLIDGDTFAYGAERIRIRGIDTPEKSDSGGFEATQRLDLLLKDGPIVVVPEAVDKYGRVVADVYVNGRNVAEVLKSEGYAKPGSR